MALTTRCSHSPTQLLRSIFIHPSSTAISAQYLPSFALNRQQPATISPRHQQSKRSYQKNFLIHDSPKPQRPQDGYSSRPSSIVWDYQITDRTVDLVDPQGRIVPGTSIREIQQRYDPYVYRLVRLSPATDTSLAKCAILNQDDFIKTVQGKGGPKMKKDPGQQKPKKVEINWAITDHDLDHKLKSMQEFLKQGRKVEVMIAPKRKGRRATEEEGRALLKKVREQVKEVSGATEWKPSDGTVLTLMSLHLSGPSVKSQEDSKGDSEEE